MKDMFRGDILAELPLGFAMNLAKNPAAMESFSHLSTQEKNEIITNIQSATTGREAEEKILRAIQELS